MVQKNARKGKYHNRQYSYLVCFVTTLDVHFSETLGHLLQREDDVRCISQIVLFMPPFQRNKVLPCKHIPDLELQIERFLPQASHTSHFSPAIEFLWSELHSTDHCSSYCLFAFSPWNWFLLHLMLNLSSLFILCHQWFPANLSTEILISKSNSWS